jgi:hypothetical protein
MHVYINNINTKKQQKKKINNFIIVIKVLYTRRLKNKKNLFRKARRILIRLKIRYFYLKF